MNYKELILQLGIIFPVFYFTQSYKSIILLSITVDSIFSAINFIYVFLLYDVSMDELLKKINDHKMYDHGIINRYLYYFLLETAYLVLCNMLWQHSITWLYYLLSFCAYPFSMNYICQKYLYKIVNFIDEEKRKFVKIIICKQLAIAINTLSNICIDKNPEINHSELLFLFDDYEKTTNNFLTFLKNFLVISLVHYTKKNTTKFYSGLLKYVYSYKTGDLIESLDLSTAKKRFTNVIINRKWKSLSDAQILQSIIYIYTLQDDNKVDYLSVYITKFNYTLLKMFTTWTIGAFFNKHYIIPLLSIFFMLYHKPLKEYYSSERMFHYVFRVIALLLGFLVKNEFLLSFICEFGYILTFNKVMNTVANYLYHKTEKILEICIHYNKYNIFFISLFLYIELTKYIQKYVLVSLEQHIITYIFCMTVIGDNYKRIIGTLIISLGFISQYNKFHQIYIIGIMYLYVNIDHYFQNNRDIAIRIMKKKIQPYINPQIIDSYYNNKKYNMSNKLMDIDQEDLDNDDTDDNDDNELVDSLLKPNKPIIRDDEEYVLKGKNVKILHKDIGIIQDYTLSKSKIIDIDKISDEELEDSFE